MISAHKIFAAIRVGREQCKGDIERKRVREREGGSALHIFQVEPTQKYISLLSASRDDKAEEKCKRLSIYWPRPFTHSLSFCRRPQIGFHYAKTCGELKSDLVGTSMQTSQDDAAATPLAVAHCACCSCQKGHATHICVCLCVCLCKYMCLLASNLMYAHLRDLRIIRLPLDWAAQAAYAQFDAPSLPACLAATSRLRRVHCVCR